MYRASRTLMAAAAGKGKTEVGKRGIGKGEEIVNKKKTAPATGILKVGPISPSLHEFLGVTEASRTQAVKLIWDYIKLHNLQTPADKRVIRCDDKLKTIFEGKEQVGFLEIGKLLSRHFIKTEA